jgi:two-component system CheB/CheR fusion protein
MAQSKASSAPKQKPKAGARRNNAANGVRKKAANSRTRHRKSETAVTKNDTSAGSSADLFPIVGIGGSAGAFEAMGVLLRTLPANTGMAFVLLQHLDPRGTSRYGELLRRDTSMPVEEIKSGVIVEPNHIYFLPAAAYVELCGRRLILTKSGGSEHLRLPIDRFFLSLAAEDKHRAIGVILSGANADGSGGLRAIREAGGITFAQSERTSKYFAMPAAAIATGCVDSVLGPEQIGMRLAQISRHPSLRAAQPEPSEPVGSSKVTIKALHSIFNQLRHRSGVDFTLYKRSTIQRRIARRMVLGRVESFESYAKMLRSSTEEMDALFNDLLINVTQFFRDKTVFAALQKRILPRILRARRTEGGDLRIWIAGCATGEEVYSLAITALETMRSLGISLGIQIFGTDLSDTAINVARTGLYPLSIAGDVSAERLRRYFTKTDTGYRVNRTLRDLCTFARQNICQDPPFSRIDLISCRNVLIYLGPELQRRCIPIFHYALSPNGYLLLGSAETIGTFADLFSMVDKRHKIYVKKMTPLRPAMDFGKPLPIPKLRPIQREADIGGEIEKEADRLVLQKMGPSGVVIDTQLQIVQFRGATSIYLEHASGDASLNLLQMVRSNLVVDLRAGIHKALKQNLPVRKEGIHLPHGRDTLLVDIDVFPFKVPNGGTERWLLVLFHSRTVKEVQAPGGDGGKEGRAGAKAGAEIRLRDELRATKESLQAIIEEQEATNEELKSANEEIESSNEELQSSNEELETAKEELQSTNEELQTLNEELNTRNTEMALVNNDLSNLLSSTNLPIIMVDNGLAVRRATPLGERLFNLIPTDIGRRLTDIKSNLKINDLDKILRRVIDTLETEERQVIDKNRVSYLMRVRPYRTQDHKIDGAVITLVDIDPVRGSQMTEALAKLTQSIAELTEWRLVVLDAALRVLMATKAFCQAIGMNKADLIGRSIFEIADGEWKTVGVRQFLQKVMATRPGSRGGPLTHRLTLPQKTLELKASTVGSDNSRMILLAATEAAPGKKRGK